MPGTTKTAPAVKKTKTATAPAKETLKTSGVKKVTAPRKEKEIKYEDKSAGQPELIPIFDVLKSLMQPYAKGVIVEQGGTGGTYGLVSKKAVEVEGRKKDEMWFAGLMVQKGYVGFYFMPVYTTTGLTEVFKPELLKCLKGKSCFHIKKNDPELMGQIKDALKVGYRLYKENGWV